MNKLLIASIIAVSIAGSCRAALAADVPARSLPPGAAVPVAAVPVAVSDWTGFYVGIHGGGGWAHESVSPSSIIDLPESPHS